MPTFIALDVSLSMQRNIPGRQDLTYHQLAVKGINQFLDVIQNSQKLEFIALSTYSTRSDLIVDFTREVELIRLSLRKVEHNDKTNFEGALKLASESLSSNWGKQNHSQVLIFSDCGLGFGSSSIRNITARFLTSVGEPGEYDWVEPLQNVKIHIICMGVYSDPYFSQSITAHQKYLDVLRLKANFYLPKTKDEQSEEHSSKISGKTPSELGRTAMSEMVERLCEQNYKQFEANLKCGGFSRLECKVLIWPAPEPYTTTDELTGSQVTRNISRNIEVCGFLSLADIGSPATISRHLVSPKMKNDVPHKKGSKSPKKEPQTGPSTEFEKLEQEIKTFFLNRGEDEPEDSHKASIDTKENACVLLHSALKIENLAAVVILTDNWYGFLYSYADSKKKSNLMLSILPPGNNNIPWLGDFRMFGMQDDILPGENVCFPVKSDKRSYSQNSVVWIKHASLQSDIQKVLRHAKKLPEKTMHFYKELNRIRRAALSIGFCELLDTLAVIFEKEATMLPPNANPDCSMQLKHAAMNLKRGMDAKTVITALPTKYNQQ